MSPSPLSFHLHHVHTGILPDLVLHPLQQQILIQEIFFRIPDRTNLLYLIPSTGKVSSMEITEYFLNLFKLVAVSSYYTMISLRIFYLQLPIFIRF